MLPQNTIYSHNQFRNSVVIVVSLELCVCVCVRARCAYHMQRSNRYPFNSIFKFHRLNRNWFRCFFSLLGLLALQILTKIKFEIVSSFKPSTYIHCEDCWCHLESMVNGRHANHRSQQTNPKNDSWIAEFRRPIIVSPCQTILYYISTRRRKLGDSELRCTRVEQRLRIHSKTVARMIKKTPIKLRLNADDS